MRATLLTTLCLLFFAGCGGQNTGTHTGTAGYDFSDCFKGLDTTDAGPTIGCTEGFYKLIGDSCVVCIHPDLPERTDTCYFVNIDGTNGKRFSKLLIFDDKKAGLENLCTDEINLNDPMPSGTLYPQSGQFILAFTAPSATDANHRFRVTVFIRSLLFIDEKTGKKIEIKNEMLWKVVDTGTPG
jgi:hypothetical protein